MTGVLGWWFAPSGSTVKEIRLPNCDDRVVVDGGGEGGGEGGGVGCGEGCAKQTTRINDP